MRIQATRFKKNAVLVREVIKSFIWKEKIYYIINLTHETELDIVNEDSWSEVPEIKICPGCFEDFPIKRNGLKRGRDRTYCTFACGNIFRMNKYRKAHREEISRRQHEAYIKKRMELGFKVRGRVAWKGV